MSNIITQVSADGPQLPPQEDVGDNTVIRLSVRGTPFQITRDELMSLPESILLCLFPTGAFLDAQGQSIANLTENDVVYVDFSPECFNYIVKSFALASNNAPSLSYDHDNILSQKPAIIVLREDLDYYCIPPKRGLLSSEMRHLKARIGRRLANNTKIFEGLGYVPGGRLGPAEQHLLDMLCNAGYLVLDDWGHRAVEPGKLVISSLALVRLDREKAGNEANQKLLLFWKKPARKCWWGMEEVVPDEELQVEQKAVRVHVRRVWTLELAVLQ